MNSYQTLTRQQVVCQVPNLRHMVPAFIEQWERKIQSPQDFLGIIKILCMKSTHTCL
jgi:hypothetical protein